MTLSQLIIVIEEKIKIHERAIPNLPHFNDRDHVRAKIRAFQEVLETIEGPTLPNIADNTPDCNCKQHKVWHWCPFHNWCNPVTGVGV